MPRHLDLCAGKHGWSQPSRDRGWDVVSLDIDPRFGCTITADLLDYPIHELAALGPFDLITASTPCESLSVGSFRHHWQATGPCRCGGRIERVPGERWEHVSKRTCSKPSLVGDLTYRPETPTARLGLGLIERTLEVIAELRPTAWVMENPRALMRALPVMKGIERRTVTYCRYGQSNMKATDLWGGFPPTLHLHPECRTRKTKDNPLQGQRVTLDDGRVFVTDENGDPCHEAAPRGAKTGTQGILGSDNRALIPYALAQAVVVATERYIEQLEEVA